MLRRRRRNPEPFAFSRSMPSKRIAPEVGSMRRRMRRPSVLLPEPDAPTRPSVSPWWMSRETSSTARISPTRRLPNRDSARSKTLVRLRTSIRGTYHSRLTKYCRLVPYSGIWKATMFSPRNHRHSRQRRDHADGPGAAEVLMQKNASKHNGDCGIERTEHDRIVQPP